MSAFLSASSASFASVVQDIAYAKHKGHTPINDLHDLYDYAIDVGAPNRVLRDIKRYMRG